MTMTSYNVKKWAELLAGGQEALQRKQRVLTQFHDALSAAEPRTVHKEHLNRQQQYLRALHVWKILQQCRVRFNWSEQDAQLAATAGGETGPFIVHDMMFVGTLRTLCSDEQWQRWGVPASAGAITGCYSQTELSHGSDVSSIATLAVFDPSNDTLQLHTPGLGATKWWSGGQGNAAQYAIVFAQLCVPVQPAAPAGKAGPNWHGVSTAAGAAAACSASGETPVKHAAAGVTLGVLRSLGVVPVFTQIRDADSHAPLPGVIVGDLGPKFGFGEVDNGFLQLRGVVVPAANMLGKTGSLKKNSNAAPGQPVAVLEATSGAKAAYAGMLFERVAMVAATVHTLAVASTVATRYSLTRRQFQDATQQRRRDKHLTLILPRNKISSGKGVPGATSMQAHLELPMAAVQPVNAKGVPQVNVPEVLVMQYQTQNTRVCSVIALTHATHAVADFLGQSHQQLTNTLAAADAAASTSDRACAISALHGLASGMKAVLSEVASAAIESCRRCCGGHGYMVAGGLVSVYSAYVHVATAGGDTYVLTQQTYKLLVGAHLGMGPREGGGYACHTVSYLAQHNVASASARRSDLQHTSMKSAHDTTLGNAIHVNGPLWLSHPVALVLALRRVAVRCTSELSGSVSRLMEGGLAAAGLGDSTAPLSFYQACASLQVMGLGAVWAHVMGVMFEVAMRRTAAVLATALPKDGIAAPHSDQWWAHLQFLGGGVSVGHLSTEAAIAASPVVEAAAAGGHGTLSAYDALVATRTLMVFGLHCMLFLAPAAMRTAVISPTEAGHARAAWTTLCSACVPDALALVDAMSLPDRSLPGVLASGMQHSLSGFGPEEGGARHVRPAANTGGGGDDSTVYAALLQSACAEPLNNATNRAAAAALVQGITEHGRAVLEHHSTEAKM